MENEELITHRLNAQDERLRNNDKKIQNLENEIKVIKEKENDRYNEVSRLNTRLDADSKNTKEIVDRLVGSVDKLVDKIDVMTNNYAEYNATVERRFNQVEKEVTNFINDKKVDTKALSNNSNNSEDTQMSKTAFTSITISVIGVIEVFVRYVAPLFFD